MEELKTNNQVYLRFKKSSGLGVTTIFGQIASQDEERITIKSENQTFIMLKECLVDGFILE